MNATQILSLDDKSAIEIRIAEIERKTSAEIVCAVATESGRYDRAESIVGLALGILAASLTYWIFQIAAFEPGSWARITVPPALLILSLVAGFLLGNYAACWLPGLRRTLVSDEQLQKEAERSASYVFMSSSIGETKSRCGILIYLALFEHKFVILPDQACREILGDSEIKTICESAVERLAKREFATAFLDVIEKVAQPLADELPADRHLNENELADHLLIFHPSVI